MKNTCVGKTNCSKCNKEISASYSCDGENTTFSVGDNKLTRVAFGETTTMSCKCSNCDTENKISLK